MNPGEKGWLKEYLEFRKDLLKDYSAGNGRVPHPEYSLYKLIQPTGIMYGQPVGATDFPNVKEWGEGDKMKILLAESLIGSALLFHDKSVKTPEDLSKVIVHALENIANFYNSIFPELATPTKTLFGSRKSSLELAERIFDKRINVTTERSNNFWVKFFHNSLLFLDIFIYGQWIHTNADRIVSDFFKYEREELRFSVVKVIACAAHSNAILEIEERRLLEYFLQSTELPNNKLREAKKIFEEGIPLDDINLPTNNSWILKKYFLEIAILTIWADKQVEESELGFIKRLNKLLGFNETDLENSQLAIEGFVLENWDHLSYLQSKQDYNSISQRYIGRMNKITISNKNRLLKEVKDSEEVMELLKRARMRELGEVEKEQLQASLIRILRTIPTFAIVSLPQRYLTLPILLKILPADFFAEVA